MVGQDETGHGFDERNGPRKDTGVVPSAPFELDGVAFAVHRFAGLQHRSYRLEADAQHDVFAVADAALDASTSVGGGSDAVPTVHKFVVVFRSPHEGATQARTQFQRLGGGQGPHRLGKVGVQAIKDRFTPTCGHTSGHQDNGAPDRVAGFLHVGNPIRHSGSRLRMRATDGMGIHFVTAVEGRGQGHADVLHALDVGAHLDPHGGKQLARHGAPGHAGHGFPCRGAAPATNVSKTILRLVGEIGMRGAEGVFEVVVIGRSSGGVGRGETQGCTRGDDTIVGLNRA